MPFPVLDILIAIVLIVGIVRGIAVGAVRQALGLAGTVVAVILGLEFMHAAGSLVGGAIGLGEQLQPPVGFVAVFLAVEIVVFVLTRMFESVLRALKLTVVNRAVGGAIGLAKSVLLLSVLFLILGLFDVPEAENRQESTLYQPIAMVFPSAWDFVAERVPYVSRLSERFGAEVGRILTAD